MRTCTATSKRTGKPCKEHVVAGRTTCYHHGGSTPRGFALPQTTTGRHSKDLPTRLAARYEESRTDPEILNLTEEIALADALIEDARRGLDHGESGRLFKAMKDAWDDLTTAQREKDASGVQMAISELGALIRQGVGAYAARDETMQLVERRRRLVDSEGKRRVAMRDSISSEKAMVLVSVLLESVIRNVRDPEALAAVTADFGALTSREDPPGA